MHELFGPGTTVGYCTNVHAGASLAETLANLERHALAVKARVCPDEPMGVGLWLSASAAREAAEPRRTAELADWLSAHGLFVFTVNGFPYGDFHRRVVKYRVYEPDWATDERLAYTLDLARILSGLLPPGGEGSISTLPLGWRGALAGSVERVERAARLLLCAADELERLEERTGRFIHLDLEPEPGCYLDRCRDVVELFQRHLLRSGGTRRARRYLGVCHDVCHAAVMFEDQGEVLETYRRAGIRVGKVQLSSALRVDFDALEPPRRALALAQLAAFSEPRYLHQTTLRERGPGARRRWHDDLGPALGARAAGAATTGEWRVHFHVPIHLPSIGLLGTTQGELYRCLEALRAAPGPRHFEVETYAWSVLPSELQPASLAAGIAEELRHLQHRSALAEVT